MAIVILLLAHTGFQMRYPLGSIFQTLRDMFSSPRSREQRSISSKPIILLARVIIQIIVQGLLGVNKERLVHRGAAKQ